MATYTFKLDDRGRQVLINALRLVKNAAEEPLLNGEFTEENYSQFEELNLLHRGVLFVRPDPDPEEPVVGPEAPINGGSGLVDIPN